MPKRLHEGGPVIGANVPKATGKGSMGGYKLSSTWGKMSKANKGKSPSGDPSDYPPVTSPGGTRYRDPYWDDE